MAKKGNEKTKTKTATAKKVTAKSVICAGILKGQTVAAILKTVGSKVPDSKADASHVGYYANAMLKSGDIKQDVRDKYVGTKGRPAAKKSKADKKAKPAKADKSSKSSKPSKKSGKKTSKKA